MSDERFTLDAGIACLYLLSPVAHLKIPTLFPLTWHTFLIYAAASKKVCTFRYVRDVGAEPTWEC